MEFWIIEFAFSAVIGLLRRFTAGQAGKLQYEKVFLKIFTLIWRAFGDLASFRKVVGLDPLEELGAEEAK